MKKKIRNPPPTRTVTGCAVTEEHGSTALSNETSMSKSSLFSEPCWPLMSSNVEPSAGSEASSSVITVPREVKDILIGI